MNRHIKRNAALVAVGLLTALAAQAQSAGSLMLRAGVTHIQPNVTSGNFSAPFFAGAKADTFAATSIGGGVTYMWTNHIAIDLPLATPFKHDMIGAGAIAGVGKIGEVQALPITLFAQYRFLAADAPARPYIGVGATYAKFFKARSTAVLTALTGGTPALPTTMSVENKFVPTLQAGAVFTIKPRWFVDVSVSHTPLKTRTTLSTGQTLDATLDPSSISIAVGYRF